MSQSLDSCGGVNTSSPPRHIAKMPTSNPEGKSGAVVPKGRLLAKLKCENSREEWDYSLADRTIPYSKDPHIFPFQYKKTGLQSGRIFLMSSHKEAQRYWWVLNCLLCTCWKERAFGPQSSTAFAMVTPEDLGMTLVGLTSIENTIPKFFFWIKDKIDLQCSSQSLLSRHEYNVF